MALNVKTAMLVCVSFVGGASWLLHQIGPPATAPAKVREVGQVPLELARTEVQKSVQVADASIYRRAGWTERFSRPNAVGVEAGRNRVVANAIPAERPLEPDPRELPDQRLATLLDEPRVAIEAPILAENEPTESEDSGIVLASATMNDVSVAKSVQLDRSYKRYRVARGDSLTRIAQREWNSSDRRLLALLVEANPKLRSRASRIMVGEELLIPDETTARETLAGKPITMVRLAAYEPSQEESVDERLYTVQRNDTLAGIARRFLNSGDRWPEIAALNGDLNPHKIQPGTRIKLPAVVKVD